MHNLLENLTFDSSVFTLSSPYEISKDLALPKPFVSTIANWMITDENVIDPVKLQKMQSSLEILH